MRCASRVWPLITLIGVGTFCALSSRRRAVTVTVCNWLPSAWAGLALIAGEASGVGVSSAAQVIEPLAQPAMNNASGKRLKGLEGNGRASGDGRMDGSCGAKYTQLHIPKSYLFMF